MNSETNSKLNEYFLLSIIGNGSFAKVLLCKRKIDNNVYAMKVINKKKLDQKSIKQFQQEQEILMNCQHPFIVKLEDAFENTKKFYIILEYCPGGDLYYLLSLRHKFTEEQTKFYAAQILLALEYLHSRDIIYRDLKPENVLIDQVGYLKLIDFGLSKSGVKGNSGAHSRCGTAEYLAPEILAGDHGKAADWWTFGAIIYEMVSGQSPFTADTRELLFEKIKNTNVNLKLSITSNMKDLLQKLFIKEPETRLGANGAQDIKNHKWFKSINWQEIENKQAKPYFLPKAHQDEFHYYDNSFDVTFDNQEQEPISYS